MAISYDQVNIWVRELIKPKLHSSYVQMKPLLYVLAGKTVANLDSLGDPQAGVVWGGAGIGRATMLQQAGSFNHRFSYQKTEADASSHVALDGATPTATVYGDDLVDNAETRWTDFWGPLRLRKDRLDAAISSGNNLRVASLTEAAVSMGFNRHLQKHQSELWTGTLTEAQQDLEVWPNYIGVQHTCDGSGTDFYGGKDRSSETELRGKEYTAGALATAGAIASGGTVPLLRMVRWLKSENTTGGVANRYAGAGDLAITTPSLWNVLANEAEGQHTIYDSQTQIPGMMLSRSMQYPVIKKDTTLITYDPDCPDGEFYLLSTDFWVFEVQKGNNFAIDEWQKKWLNDEGGAKYLYTQIHAKTRLTCYRPDLQVKITGLTVA